VEGDGVDLPGLRARLRRALPAYLVPAVMVPVDRFALTTSGKIDRSRLPAPDGRRPDVGTYTRPGTDAERVLAAVWAAELRVERVGRTDDFFDLGGHSLVAMRIAAKVRSGHALPVSARDLLEWCLRRAGSR
jgi:hypothetical protein